MRIQSTITIAVCLVASASCSPISSGLKKYRQPFKVGFDNAFKIDPSSSLSVKKDFSDLRGGGKAVAPKSLPAFLKWAYSAVGLATTAAWTTIVITTIRSNQPLGAIMPCMQHGLVNRISVLSAVPLILSSYGFLRSAADSDTWDKLSSESCRRQNLVLVATGVASALWVNFAPIITKVPGSELSHQVYTGLMKQALLGAFTSGAALSAYVWKNSLPEDTPLLSLPGRVVDGVAKSIVSIAPVDSNNPINVKYALLTTGFLILTAIQTLGPHPLSVVPSWTGRRLARAFPAWTLLAAVTSFDLKESAEKGKVLLHDNRILSRGIKGYGVVYLASKVGAVFFDPSFPVHYPAVQAVPGWAAAAIIFTTLTLRSDVVGDTLCNYVKEDIEFVRNCFGVTKKD